MIQMNKIPKEFYSFESSSCFLLFHTSLGEATESLLHGESIQMSKLRDMTFPQLINATKIPCISICLNFFTTVSIQLRNGLFVSLLVISFYSFVPSDGKFVSLVQVLNYASLIADFFGRQLVLMRGQRCLIITNSTGVLFTVLARCIMTIGMCSSIT